MCITNLPEYVVEQLVQIVKAADFKEYSFEQDVGSKHGDGFMGTMVKITVTGKRFVSGTLKSDKLHLICKMLPPGKAHRDLFCLEAVFAREVELYNRILPIFTRFQTEKGLNETNGFFAFPNCYYAISDAKQDHHLIIMDDLRPLGYTLWNKQVSLEYDNVRLLLTSLGRCHAVSFALRDQQPAVFDTFRSLDDLLLHIIDNSLGMESFFNDGMDQSIRMFQGGATEELEYLTGLRDTWKDIFPAILGSDQIGEFSVIGHGDCWNNNFMFLNKENKADKICLLDWQMSRLGSPALDLSYFFMSSTDKALRDKHFDEFLQIYYTNLASTLRACGSDPDKLFTFTDLQVQLKRYGKYGATVAPVYLQMMVNNPDNIKDMNSFVEQDESEPKEMATFDDTSKNIYMKRLKGVITDAKAQGWIK